MAEAAERRRRRPPRPPVPLPACRWNRQPRPAPLSGVGKRGGKRRRGAITISNFAYEIPGAVAPGAEVKVINMDTAEHTVTADQDATLFDVEVKENGGTATFKAPSEPGTYAFHCNYHPNMHGSLTVK